MSLKSSDRDLRLLPALNALNAGAAGVIIINSEDKTFVIDDPAIASPLGLSVSIIGKSSGDTLLGTYRKDDVFSSFVTSIV